jgi:hypothetical protein
MPIRESTAFCKQCGRQVLARRTAPSHLFHAIMTILTLGVWLIIWLIAALGSGAWRCSVCGAKVSPGLFA